MTFQAFLSLSLDRTIWKKSRHYQFDWACAQGRIKRGGNGVNCPGFSTPRGPPWWHLFVL